MESSEQEAASEKQQVRSSKWEATSESNKQEATSKSNKQEATSKSSK